MCAPPDSSEEPEQSADMPLEDEHRDEDVNSPFKFAAVTTGAFMANSSLSDIYIDEEDANQLEFILMVLIPLVLFALLFLSVIIIVIRYKRKRNKQGKYFVCPHFWTITSWVKEQSVKQSIFCFFYTEPSSQGSQSVLQTCEYDPNACPEWGVGEDKEGRGFKVEQTGVHKIVNDEFPLFFQKKNGFSLN